MSSADKMFRSKEPTMIDVRFKALQQEALLKIESAKKPAIKSVPSVSEKKSEAKSKLSAIEELIQGICGDGIEQEEEKGEYPARNINFYENDED